MFPSLIGLPGETSSELEVDRAWTMNEEENLKTAEILNPIEERDKTIFEQHQLIENLKEFQLKATSLSDQLHKMEVENAIMKKKISFTRRATEDRIFENITNKESYREDPLLVAVLSATLDEDELETDEIEEEVQASFKTEHRSRKDMFLWESLDSKIDKNDEMQQERLSHIKNQVLEKIKVTKLSRRSLSSKRRHSLLGNEDGIRSTSRPRTASPPAKLQ